MRSLSTVRHECVLPSRSPFPPARHDQVLPSSVLSDLLGRQEALLALDQAAQTVYKCLRNPSSVSVPSRIRPRVIHPAASILTASALSPSPSCGLTEKSEFVEAILLARTWSGSLRPVHEVRWVRRTPVSYRAEDRRARGLVEVLPGELAPTSRQQYRLPLAPAL